MCTDRSELDLSLGMYHHHLTSMAPRLYKVPKVNLADPTQDFKLVPSLTIGIALRPELLHMIIFAMLRPA